MRSTSPRYGPSVRRTLPILGERRVDAITAHDVQAMVTELYTAGKKRGTIRKSVGAVAMVLDYERITPNPARDKVIVKLPRDDSEDINPPTAEQIVAVYRTFSADAIRTAIAKACRGLGIPVWSPHDLRHRRVSLLHAQGWSWARIGEYVGQRDIKTTADIYTHVLIDETEVAYADLLAAAA